MFAKLAAVSTLLSFFGIGHINRPGCRKLYPVNTIEATARHTYAGTRDVTLRDLKLLGYREMCVVNPAKHGLVRSYDRHQGVLWRERRTPTWAIPWSIVSCESHGHDDPPNSAGASGYYQIIPSTWIAYGGGKFASEAYEASKPDQDIVASRIWAGGSGATQWVCKA